jgi:Uma2 family endonuclease
MEPVLHLGEDVLVPDLAGWRLETMSVVPRQPPFFTVRPDWLCEVLSASTERHDRGAKVRLYAAAGVTNAWLVNPLQHTLEVLRPSASTPSVSTTLAVFTEDAEVSRRAFRRLRAGARGAVAGRRAWLSHSGSLFIN